jgi:uncharacterized protein
VNGFVYLDSSAVAKLILAELESDALRTEFRNWPLVISSSVTGIETRRAVARVDDARGSLGKEADIILEGLPMVDVSPSIAAVAARIAPPSIRTLDAIQLATILSLGDRIAAAVIYDKRLAEAARHHGLTTVAPGAAG